MLRENFNVEEWLVKGEEILFELVSARLDEDEDIEDDDLVDLTDEDEEDEDEDDFEDIEVGKNDREILTNYRLIFLKEDFLDYDMEFVLLKDITNFGIRELYTESGGCIFLKVGRAEKRIWFSSAEELKEFYHILAKLLVK